MFGRPSGKFSSGGVDRGSLSGEGLHPLFLQVHGDGPPQEFHPHHQTAFSWFTAPNSADGAAKGTGNHLHLPAWNQLRIGINAEAARQDRLNRGHGLSPHGGAATIAPQDAHHPVMPNDAIVGPWTKVATNEEVTRKQRHFHELEPVPAAAAHGDSGKEDLKSPSLEARLDLGFMPTVGVYDIPGQPFSPMKHLVGYLNHLYPAAFCQNLDKLPPPKLHAR